MKSYRNVNKKLGVVLKWLNKNILDYKPKDANKIKDAFKI